MHKNSVIVRPMAPLAQKPHQQFRKIRLNVRRAGMIVVHATRASGCISVGATKQQPAKTIITLSAKKASKDNANIRVSSPPLKQRLQKCLRERPIQTRNWPVVRPFLCQSINYVLKFLVVLATTMLLGMIWRNWLNLVLMLKKVPIGTNHLRVYQQWCAWAIISLNHPWW